MFQKGLKHVETTNQSSILEDGSQWLVSSLSDFSASSGLTMCRDVLLWLATGQRLLLSPGLNVSWRIFAPGVAKRKGIPSYNQSYTPKSPKIAFCYEDNLANRWWTQWELGVPYYFQFHFGCKEHRRATYATKYRIMFWGAEDKQKQTDQSGNTMEFPMLYPSHQWNFRFQGRFVLFSLEICVHYEIKQHFFI